MKLRDVLLWSTLGFAILIGLLIIPGLDFLFWHIMQPNSFWEKIVLIVVECITAPLRILAALGLWTIISSFAFAVFD